MNAPSCTPWWGALLIAMVSSCESPPVADSDLTPVDEPAVPSLAQAGTTAWRAANSGIEGGDVRALAVDPLASRTLYANTRDGGLYKSVDGARSWRLAGAGLPRMAGAVAVHPRRAGIVYVATAAGLFRSSDGGRNFRPAGQLEGPLYAPLHIAPSEPTTLYVRGLSGYLQRSDDAGATWTFSTQRFVWFVVHPRDAAVVYGVTDDGEVHKSTDRGTRFTRVGRDLPTNTDSVAHTLALDPNQPDTLLVGIAGHGLYRSRDGGMHFEPLGAEVASGQAYGAIVVDPLDSRRILLSASLQARSGALFLSEDDGASFTRVGVETSPLHAAFDPRDDRNIYLASADGTYKSVDRGRTFTRSVAGFHNVGIDRIVADARLPGALLAAGRHLLCRTTDWGARWSCSKTLPDASISGLVADPTRARGAYVGFRMPDRQVPSTSEPGVVTARPQPGRLYTTEDGGRSWREITGDIGPYATLTPLTVAPDSGDLFVMARGRIDELSTDASVQLFRSADRGGSWQALTVPAGLSDVFLAVTRAQLFTASELGGMFASQDGGRTWTRSDIDLMAVSGLAVDPRDRQVLYAAARLSRTPYPLRGGLRKSIDGGRSWFAPYEPLAEAEVTGLAVGAVDGRLYVRTSLHASEQPVLTSADGGSTFTPAGDGLAPNAVSVLASDPFEPCTAYAGTVGQGVFVTQRAGGTCSF